MAEFHQLIQVQWLRLPVELAWSRPCASWSAALRAEARVKRLRRAQQVALLAGADVLGLH